jgi:RNA polymerase-binding protein DksA
MKLDAKKLSIQQALQTQYAELKERHDKLAKHVAHRDTPLPADFAEQAVELENDETMVRLLEHSQAELREIQGALDRLAEGTYGICESCGVEIAAGRLEAIPTSTLCVACVADD